jgi:hypothetical protein
MRLQTKHILILVSIIWNTINSFSQGGAKIDSMISVASISRYDSVKAKTYNHIANFYIKKNSDSAKKYLSAARKAAARGPYLKM